MIILRPHHTFAVTYLDDVVIHAETWEEHLTPLHSTPESPVGAQKGWTHSQPEEVPSGTHRSMVPWISDWSWPHQAPGGQDFSSP